MTSIELVDAPATARDLSIGVRNVRLPIHRIDWSRVRCFEKCMWRTYTPCNVRALPRPVVLYSYHPHLPRIDTVVALLTETWREPLGAISEADLDEEGFASRVEFKRYFAERYPNLGFRPLDQVQVHRVAPLTDDMIAAWKDHAWQRCYGSFAA